jgi:signal transduction histidine kinase
MRGIGFIFFLLALPAALFPDVPILDVPADGTVRDFGEKACLLFHPGNADYSASELDDRAWVHVSAPHTWKRGHFTNNGGVCWYRLHLRFPGGIPEHNPGIELGRIADIDDVWFNGAYIGRNGYVLSNQTRYAYDKVRIYELPVSLVRTNGDNVLAIRVIEYDTDCGLFSGNYRVGPYHELEKKLLMSEMGKLLFAAIYIVIGFYFLMLGFRRRTDSEYLWFAVICFTASAYFGMLSEVKYSFTVNYLLLKKFEYLSLTLIVPLFLQFNLRFFRHPATIVDRIYLLLTIPILLLLLILREPSSMWWVFTHFVHFSWIYGVGRIFHILLRYVRVESDARVMLAGVLVMSFSALNDILFSRALGRISGTGYISTFGFLIFLVCIASVLANRLVRLHREVEALNGDLQRSFETIQEQNLRLRQSDSIKTELMANISHEIRTPVSNIYGAVELLAGGDVDLTNREQVRAMFHSIFTELRLLKRIINNFLVLSSLEHSDEYLTRIEVRRFLREFRAQTLDGEFTDPIRENSLHVMYPAETSLTGDIHIEADAEYLKHMLGEIVHNAIVYNKTGGTVSVDAVEVNGYLAFVIEETGIGVPREDLDNVFSRFFRVRYPEGRNVPGTGLGLSVAHAICERRGWNIELQSEVGIYTRVSVGGIPVLPEEAENGACGIH